MTAATLGPLQVKFKTQISAAGLIKLGCIALDATPHITMRHRTQSSLAALSQKLGLPVRQPLLSLYSAALVKALARPKQPVTPHDKADAACHATRQGRSSLSDFRPKQLCNWFMRFFAVAKLRKLSVHIRYCINCTCRCKGTPPTTTSAFL